MRNGTHCTGGKAAVNLCDGLRVERSGGGGRRRRVGFEPKLRRLVVQVAQELLVRRRFHRRTQNTQRYRREFDEAVVVDVNGVARQIPVCYERHLRMQITGRSMQTVILKIRLSFM